MHALSACWVLLSALLVAVSGVIMLQVGERAHQALVGRRLSPQKPRSPPFFEGWYTRVVGPTHSFGILTGHFPGQTSKHSAAYTSLLVNHDNARGRLVAYEAYAPHGAAPDLVITQQPQHQASKQQRLNSSADFLVAHPERLITVQARGNSLLYEARLGGAAARFQSLSGSTPWSDGGGGSPQGLLHLLPGVGLHWYVHSTLTRVAYEVSLPDGEGTLSGEGWAHVEKNWGGSFPRSFIWSQGFASQQPCRPADGGNGSSGGCNGNGNGSGTSHPADSNGAAAFDSTSTDIMPQPQATFCLAGGVLPTLNADKLPVPLPNAVLMGYRSSSLNWHFAPQSPTLFSTTVEPEEGKLVVHAWQLGRSLVLRVNAGLDTFSRVGGPTRGGVVPHSVESYSATATVECYQYGRLIEVAHFDRAALEFGGSYACRAEEAAGRSADGLFCSPQWEQ